MTFTYKRDPSGAVIGHKACFSYSGSRFKDGRHYEIKALAVFTADRDIFWLVIAIETDRGVPLRHLGLKRAFINEQYDGPEALLLNHMQTSELGEDRMISFLRVHKSVYRIPQAPHTYAVGIVKNLTAQGY